MRIWKYVCIWDDLYEWIWYENEYRMNLNVYINEWMKYESVYIYIYMYIHMKWYIGI